MFMNVLSFEANTVFITSPHLARRPIIATYELEVERFAIFCRPLDATRGTPVCPHCPVWHLPGPSIMPPPLPRMRAGEALMRDIAQPALKTDIYTSASWKFLFCDLWVWSFKLNFLVHWENVYFLYAELLSKAGIEMISSKFVKSILISHEL